MAQAQGTSPGASADTRLKPSGNGRPIRKASGAIKMVVSAALAARGKPISFENANGSAMRYVPARRKMPTAAETSAEASCETKTTSRGCGYRMDTRRHYRADALSPWLIC